MLLCELSRIDVKNNRKLLVFTPIVGQCMSCTLLCVRTMHASVSVRDGPGLWPTQTRSQYVSWMKFTNSFDIGPNNFCIVSK